MSGRLRGVIAAFLVSAIALAVGLAASPPLHTWFHDLGHGSNHECAATLISSGSVEHSACEPAPTAPRPAPTAPAFRTQLFHGALALLEFSLLEHAPPARH